MDTTLSKHWEDTLAILTELYPMPEPSIIKCSILYHLAAQVTEGVIVELGTYHGKTAVALARGTQVGHNVPVFCVDDYANRKDWANEVSTIDDVAILNQNLKYANVDVTHIYKSTQNAALGWAFPVSLFFWDTSSEGELFPDWLAWRNHIQGIAFLRDTYDRRLGSEQVLFYESERDDFDVLRHDPGILLLKRRAKYA